MVIALFVASPAKGMAYIPLQALPMVFAGGVIVWKKVSDYYEDKWKAKINGQLTNLEEGQERLEKGQEKLETGQAEIKGQITTVKTDLEKKIDDTAAKTTVAVQTKIDSSAKDTKDALEKKIQDVVAASDAAAQEEHEKTRKSFEEKIDSTKAALQQQVTDAQTDLKQLLASYQTEHTKALEATSGELAKQKEEILEQLKSLDALAQKLAASDVQSKKDLDTLKKLVDQRTAEIYATIKIQGDQTNRKIDELLAQQKENKEMLGQLLAFTKTFEASTPEIEDIDDSNDKPEQHKSKKVALLTNPNPLVDLQHSFHRANYKALHQSGSCSSSLFGVQFPVITTGDASK